MTPTNLAKKKLKRPIPLPGIERRVYAAVLLSLACGMAWSLSKHDWQYFERAGSLVILVGIALAWRDLVSELGNMENFYRTEFARLLAAIEASRPRGIIAGVMHDGKRKQIEAKCSDIEELVSMLRYRVRTTEAAILCLGTVVWGYGSIIGNFFWSFP